MGTNIAIVGDIHGSQDKMYEAALKWQERNNKTLDAILQVGDFETIRHEADFEHYFAPAKYRHISDFSGYYTGLKEAPIMTIFISGNHEAWGHLAMHKNGGFVAPNMCYLGRSGSINLKGINIGGLSGIYCAAKYKRPIEQSPSINWKYYRETDVDNVKDVKLDILLLHDWIKPVSALDIASSKNIHQNMIESSPVPSFNLVLKSRPKYVFMGHMHCSYLEGKLGDTYVCGLSRFRGEERPESFKVLDFPSE